MSDNPIKDDSDVTLEKDGEELFKGTVEKPKKKPAKPKEKYPQPDGFTDELWGSWCEEAKRRYYCIINNEPMF